MLPSRAADTLLLTVPNQLGVEYNARLLETVARQIAPAIGWQPPTDAAPANGRTSGKHAGIPASGDQPPPIASRPGRRTS